MVENLLDEILHFLNSDCRDNVATLHEYIDTVDSGSNHVADPFLVLLLAFLVGLGKELDSGLDFLGSDILSGVYENLLDFLDGFFFKFRAPIE